MFRISNEEITIPPATFETELTLPSTDFQKIIRDMTNIGDKMEIKSIGNTLKLNCTGDFAEQETILYETQGGLQIFQHLNHLIYQLLEYIFIKISNVVTKCIIV